MVLPVSSILSRNDKMPMSRSVLLRPTILFSLACVMMVGLQGWTEWGAYTTQVRETETSLVNLASSLAQHAENTINIADTAVVDIVTLLETYGTSPEMLASLG